MKNLIEGYCKKLRLSKNLVETYNSFGSLTNEEFLVKILETELIHRDHSKRGRAIKQAGFPSYKTFEGYSFEEIRIPTSITETQLKELMFLGQKENLILYGNIGAGKTHMATALGMLACNQGKNVKFFRTSSLINHLSEAKKKNTLENFLKKFEKLDLLILDEWGYVPMDREGAQLIFQIISECYEKCSIILTTNLEFSRWVSILYDENMTTALIDRLVHHSHLLIFEGGSHRLKKLQKG